MMKQYALVITLLIMTAPVSWSQTFSCGSALQDLPESDRERLRGIEHRIASPFPKGAPPDTVALTIHIIETNAPSSTLRTGAIEREITRLNAAFEDAGLYFQQCGPQRIIKGEDAYSFSSSERLNRSHHVPNTINVYFTDWLESDQGHPLCGFAIFPWMNTPRNRYIMMSKSCMDGGNTLTHEFGHFYGLYHTHETFFGTEYVDGSNCRTTGDLICDTPADPNLARSFITNGCSYQGTQKDPRGEAYLPPVRNFMSYAPSKCRREFSFLQNMRIRSVHQEENAYLYPNCDFYPDFNIAFNIGSSVTIRSGAPIQASYLFDHVGLQKDHNLALNFYISEEPGAFGSPIRQEVINIPADSEALQRNYTIDFPGTRGSGQYYLTAKIDAYDRVIEREEGNNTVSLLVNVDNSGLDDARLFPNPVREELRFFLRSREVRGKLYARIYRSDGRLVRELLELYKQDEELLGRANVADLSPGLFLLSVHFEEGDEVFTFRFWKE